MEKLTGELASRQFFRHSHERAPALTSPPPDFFLRFMPQKKPTKRNPQKETHKRKPAKKTRKSKQPASNQSPGIHLIMAERDELGGFFCRGWWI
ncbi:MAG: hypothetical protein ACI30R_08610 [Sodaliphilus sp.]